MAQPNETESSKIHIAMFPWFAMGHITPFFHLANELAARGHRISFLTPKKAQLKLQDLNLYPHLITFCPITVPHVEGLPEGAETASDGPSSMVGLLATAMDLTYDQIEGFLKSSVESADHKIDMVFFDLAYWVPEIARRLGIKSIFFSVISASTYAYIQVPSRNYASNEDVTEDKLRQPPPGYPSSTAVLQRSYEVQSLLGAWDPALGGGTSFFRRASIGVEECDTFCIRTTRELEGDFWDYLKKIYKKSVLLTGPVLGFDSNKKSLQRLDDKWEKWLAGFPAGSVVFCAFGSEWVLQKDQFQELVLGFEQTGLPFFVALKPPVGCDTVEEALPEGFEERVKGRGVVHGGWVQQPLILRHESVGCFVHHCGFGSTWESLMSDNQIVLVPFVFDQFFTAKVLVKDLKVAVEVEREENGWFSKESLSNAILTVMGKDNEVGTMVKNNHAKLLETLSSPGFRSGYVDRFIEKLKEAVQ